jgi:hypothetical protein
VRQQPFERGSSNRRPNEPFDNGHLGGIEGMQIGIRLPFFTQSCHVPTPCVRPTDHLQGVPVGGHVGQNITAAFRTRRPAEDESQTQGLAIDLPLAPQCDPLPFGQPSEDHLKPLVTERVEALAVFAKRLHDLRMPPRFGPAEKGAVRGLHATPVGQIDVATLR